ncbi:MAG: response regulator transcription factor [Bacteroidetes bacterium]|nr:MAG: response regulator transcription factor [Bacteroidota bacterium]
MNCLIIEDEAPAARRLEKMIREIDPELQILGVLDSVESALRWFDSHTAPDLLLLDVQLSDGISFEILQHKKITSSIIFTTAYDEYALQAFKENSIDYLLKPIVQEELSKAIAKFKQHQGPNAAQLDKLLENLQPRTYKNRFLLKKGESLIPIQVEDIAFFHAQAKHVVLVAHSKEQFMVDETLDALEQQLNPNNFFRANRSYLVSAKSVKELRPSFNGKMKLFLEPKAPDDEVMVSRDKAPELRQWLSR